MMAVSCTRSERSSRTDGDAITLSLQVMVRHPTQPEARYLAPLHTAFSAERMQVRTWADKPAFIYVAHVAPLGERRWLFPADGVRRVAANNVTHLPPAGGEYALDAQTGNEELIVVASRVPLSAAATERLRLPWPIGIMPNGSRGEDQPPKSEQKSEQKTEQKAPPRREVGSTAGRRDGELFFDSVAQTASVRSGQDGVAILHFVFKHALH